MPFLAEHLWRNLVPDGPSSVHLAPWPEPVEPDPLRISDVVGLSMDAMQGLIARYRMAGLPPDVLVTVPVSAARSLDFHRVTEMIELGQQLTAQALDVSGH